MFKQHSSSFFTLDFAKLELPVMNGKAKVPWRPGMKLTSTTKRCCKSDGSPFDTKWHGFPWVESHCDLDGVESYDQFRSLAFRRETEFVFSGLSLGWFGVRPAKIHYRTQDVWPKPDVEGGLKIALTPEMAAKAANMGVLTHFFNNRALVYGVSSDQLRQLGYHQLGRVSVVPISSGGNGMAFPSANRTSDLVGISNATINNGIPGGGLRCGSFQVARPDVACALHPWLANVPVGTEFSISHSLGKKEVKLFCQDVVPEIFCRTAHSFLKDQIITYPEEIKVWPRDLLVCAHYQDEPCFIGFPDQLTPFRKLSGFVNDTITKRRLWIPGAASPEVGFYCLTSETVNLIPVDRKGRLASVKELRESFPWATNEHLSYSISDLALHDKFLKLQGSDGWLSLPLGFGRGQNDERLLNIAKAHFDNDEDVFITSPVLKNTLYFPPSYSKLKSNGALDAYMKSLADDIPVFSDIISDPDASSSFLLMSISA